jgi:hypothetical protein
MQARRRFGGDDVSTERASLFASRNYERTQRGFAIFGSLQDDYDADVSAMESSDIGGHIWLRIKGGAITDNGGASLLSPKQARTVARLLLEGADYIEACYGD